MQIKVVRRYIPFSHKPGMGCVLPFTTWQVQIYPTLVVLKDLKNVNRVAEVRVNFNLQGPVNNFTIEQNLEKGHVNVYGISSLGYVRYQIYGKEKEIIFFFERLPKDQIKCRVEDVACSLNGGEQVFHPKESLRLKLDTHYFPVEKPLENLCFGIHKSQDWEMVDRRSNLAEIFPFWLRVGQLVPTSNVGRKSAGISLLLDRCEELIETEKKENIVDLFFKVFKAGFFSILVPRLIDDDYQGIMEDAEVKGDVSPLILLTKGAQLIRSLFFQEGRATLKLLPCLFPIFNHGRFINIQTSFGLLDLEWRKKIIRRVILHSKVEAHISFDLQRGVKRFRLRTSREDRGKFYLAGDLVALEENRSYYFDRFQK